MALIFQQTCGTCGAAVTTHKKLPKYDHVSAVYGGIANTHEVTKVVSIKVEDAA